MKERYEGHGLVRFFRVVITLAVIGALSVVGWIGWGIWQWIK
jgi:hypothetical protein